LMTESKPDNSGVFASSAYAKAQQKNALPSR